MKHPKTKTGSSRQRAADTMDPGRMERLLAAAACEFNERGIAGAVLGSIAQQVGLSRAALYYYVENREELAFRCYLRTCEMLHADLLRAREGGPTGLQRVLGFIRLAADPARPPAAVLSEIPYLGEQRRRQVETLHARNVEVLRGLLAAGIEDGSIRPCDTEVAAQSIVGMLFWVPLSGEWIEGLDDRLTHNAARVLSDLIARGVSAQPQVEFHCHIDVASFAPGLGNIFDRREAANARVEQIVRVASRLFNRHGIDGTSLDQITASLGATKGAFYHYFKDKNALVVRCYERAYQLYMHFAEAAATGANGRERAFIGLHLNAQAQVSPLSPLSPLTGVASLPAAARRKLRKLSRQLELRFESFAEQGIADGTLRSYDVKTISVVGAGAFGWLPKWISEDDKRGARAVADEIVALFARGLENQP